MQYLVSVIDDTAGLATPDEMAAINAFNDRLKAEGRWPRGAQLGHRHRQPRRGGRCSATGPSWSRNGHRVSGQSQDAIVASA
jgi:hypothetical protein